MVAVLRIMRAVMTGLSRMVALIGTHNNISWGGRRCERTTAEGEVDLASLLSRMVTSQGGPDRGTMHRRRAAGVVSRGLVSSGPRARARLLSATCTQCSRPKFRTASFTERSCTKFRTRGGLAAPPKCYRASLHSFSFELAAHRRRRPPPPPLSVGTSLRHGAWKRESGLYDEYESHGRPSVLLS